MTTLVCPDCGARWKIVPGGDDDQSALCPNCVAPPVYRARTCVCGHPIGDHKSAGTVWPHPPRYGFCFINGCGCTSYEEVPKEQAA